MVLAGTESRLKMNTNAAPRLLAVLTGNLSYEVQHIVTSLGADMSDIMLSPCSASSEREVYGLLI